MSTVGILGAMALFATACSSLEPTQGAANPRMAKPGPDAQYRVDMPKPGPAEDRYIRMTLGQDIANQCEFSEAHFAFDSAEPLPQERRMIVALADCLRRPALEGHQITLVGRADPRGGNDYNQSLGMRRAEQVKAVLVAQGIPAERISTMSSGAAEALGGNDPAYSYGYDRRVDIVLRDTHAPAGKSGPAYRP
ncbi:OmpA family protein [Chondromyces apiculatus]|nr:OmpA family protein [Chondromyces apiculatus]